MPSDKISSTYQLFIKEKRNQGTHLPIIKNKVDTGTTLHT